MTAYEVGRESSNSVLVNVINVIGFQMSQRNAINGREKKIMFYLCQRGRKYKEEVWSFGNHGVMIN